jgi:hypothetical protein
MNMKIRFALLLIVSLFAVSANGAPMAYSVNSDNGTQAIEDSLYLIDLATGDDQHQGRLSSGNKKDDTEGLAIAPDGTLWGIDDESLTLFPIDKSNGSINLQDEIQLNVSGFQESLRHDFGMTFSCDNTLYVTSLNSSDVGTVPTLYRLSMDGSSQIVGSAGALGVNISAIAAIGNPTRLYGVGNGQFENGTTDSPNLYSINTDTGLAKEIGPLGMGDTVDAYNEAGLGFASDGTLWAITDRSALNNNPPSQILQINVSTGAATPVSYTNGTGFESLAISKPAGCSVMRLGDDYSPIPTDDYSPIPTLNPAGRLLAIFLILLTGLVLLRKRNIQ